MTEVEDLERIRKISNEELLALVDKAIELTDDFLELLGVAVMQPGTELERRNGHLGHAYECEIAEVVMTGQHYFVAYVDRLVDEGYLKDRTEFPQVDVDELDQIKMDAADAGITFRTPDYGFAEPVMNRRMAKLRADTHWVRHDGWGWYLMPEGLAYLDGALDQVVSLEIDNL